MRRIAGFALVLLTSCLAKADTVLINFETVPVEATGPSVLGSGPSQTVVVPGVATITGGVILGNETNLPAQSFAPASSSRPDPPGSFLFLAKKFVPHL